MIVAIVDFCLFFGRGAPSRVARGGRNGQGDGSRPLGLEDSEI